MAPYIYGHRNKIHIINLEKSIVKCREAMKYCGDLASRKGLVLFVSTKRQARDIIAEEAKRCGMPYVNMRWLGGMLTNFKTVGQSIKRLKDLEKMINEGGLEGLSKKEALTITRDYQKLETSLGGIKDMSRLPDAIFLIDVGYHKITVQEAQKRDIPVVGVVDTNHSPEGIVRMIPGNDDSSRAIRLYARAIADAILEGKARQEKELVKSIAQDDAVQAEDAPSEPESVVAKESVKE